MGPGFDPTGIGVPTVLVAVAIGLTVSESAFTTYVLPRAPLVVGYMWDRSRPLDLLNRRNLGD